MKQEHMEMHLQQKDETESVPVQQRRRITLCTLSALLLCSSAWCIQAERPPELRQLLELRSIDGRTATEHRNLSDAARMQAQRDAAQQLGAQAGLAWRSVAIMQPLMQHSRELSRIYNFHPLLIGGLIRPPVITQGKKSFTLNSDGQARATEQVYRIIEQARIVSAAPVWQDYLLMDTPKSVPGNALPPSALLPENDAERQRWKAWLLPAWHTGIAQAEQIFKQNLSRLERDYAGMLEYHRLKLLGMANDLDLHRTPPAIVRKADALRIHDRSMRLTRRAGFTDPADWTPALAQPKKQP
ncbi:MAG: type IV secretory system conjugative DNA transfer family protein [Candidatus Eutrophobiaceae bacterium]